MDGHLADRLDSPLVFQLTKTYDVLLHVCGRRVFIVQLHPRLQIQRGWQC